MTDSDVPQPLSLDDRIRVCEESLGRLLDWIGRYETKSSFVFGIVTAMLGALAAIAPVVPVWGPLPLVASSLAAASLVTSLCCLYRGNYPRTKGEESLIYFMSIAAMSSDNYRRRIAALTSQGYLDELLAQTHVVSRILDVKFRMLAWVYRGVFAALPFWAVAIYLLRGAVPVK